MQKILSAMALFFAATAFAQQHQKCATIDAIQAFEEKNPGYKSRANSAFNAAKAFSQHHAAQRSSHDTVYRIRTVFHVVYTKPEENLDDSVILSQLRVMNEDFRRRNPDTVRTRDIFKPFADDAGIEFFLAEEDPEGNPTTGITHTAGSPAPSFFGGYSPGTDDVKKASLGGVNPWPTDRYLNIWVCNLFGGLGVLGYAFPPAAPLPNWGTQNPNGDSTVQGVVLHFSAVGANNPAPIAPQADGGRSATHEIGHYLGLRHIWGDDQDFFGINCRCAGDPNGGDDGVDDTPDAKCPSQQDCDTTRNTCPDPNMDQDYPDQIENYMDYSDDDCLNMFTKGQIALMRSVIQLYRPGIAELTVNTTSGIKQIGITSNDFVVFPNPASSILNIATTGASSINEVMIYNAQGSLVHQSKVAESNFNLNISEWNAGVYFAVLKTENSVATKRFVKQ